MIPTGYTGTYKSLSELERKIYDIICRRFLSIFFPSAEYEKYSMEFIIKSLKGVSQAAGSYETAEQKSYSQEHFTSSFRFLKSEGYLKLYKSDKADVNSGNNDIDMTAQKLAAAPAFKNIIFGLKKGDSVNISDFEIKEGETSPPKRYTSGSMMLAMENAGQLIEDEELRSLIKGSGIGTSATRAEILKKLFTIKYLMLNNKTQIITPTLLGEMVYEAVNSSISQLLNPELTASWEKGLNYVSEGSLTPEEYMKKLENFVAVRTANVIRLNNQYKLKEAYDKVEAFYKN